MRRCWRRQARMREAAFDDRAQATLEYALTVAALMAVVVALALLWRAGETGVLARLVEDACSHVLDGMARYRTVLARGTNREWGRWAFA